jgi:TPR repeat protein
MKSPMALLALYFSVPLPATSVSADFALWLPPTAAATAASPDAQPPVGGSPACTEVNERTLNSMGVRLAQGVGVGEDPQEALLLFSAAAGYLYPEAMLNLATMYSSGRGVERDDLLAYAWLRASIVFGAQDSVLDIAVDRLALVASRLGTTNLRAAHRRAQTLVIALTDEAARAKKPLPGSPEPNGSCVPVSWSTGAAGRQILR